MSELINHFEDGIPYFAFHSQVGDIVATPDNSTLFLHDFEWAGYDHLFIATEEHEETVLGVFLWRPVADKIGDEFFVQLSSELQDHDWDTVLADKPTDEDMAQFNKYIMAQTVEVTDKGIEEWLSGTST